MTVVVMAALAVSLSACGRKSRPLEPEGSSYPRRYPEVSFPEQQKPASPQQDERQSDADAPAATSPNSTTPNRLAPAAGAGYGTETRTR
jgi:predicted small lipoprotein YifL